MARDFVPKLAPVHPPPVEKPIPLTLLVFKSFLARRQTIFLIATVQLLICTIFPGRWAAVPIATLLLGITTTEIIDYFVPGPRPPPPYLRTVVTGRTSSLLPQTNGSFGSSPSSQSLVVFHLGVQFNHPRGVLSPGSKEIADKFAEMNHDLLKRREELGLISLTAWDGAGGRSKMTSYYFKNVEAIHQFAHEEMHRKAWDWYKAGTYDHIGIFHETFVVPAHSYETIYENCKPLMLGAGLVKCGEMEGERKWRNTLVSADNVGLKSQWQRMNRDGNGIPR